MATPDPSDRPFTQRSSDLHTLAGVVWCFLGAGSPRNMIAGLSVASVLRAVVGNFGPADLVVLVVSMLLVGVVEWAIHLFLLHAPANSWRTRVLKTGVGHRQHHLDPQDIGHILIRPRDALLYLGLLLGFNATWPLAIAWAFSAPLLGTYLTAVVTSYALLVHYEWTHLLVHAKYRPKLAYYQRRSLHHRLHHFRNERYWLGVTACAGDAVLGTLPASKSDVPLSKTARAL